jgi:hypothetical protein
MLYLYFSTRENAASNIISNISSSSLRNRHAPLVDAMPSVVVRRGTRPDIPDAVGKNLERKPNGGGTTKMFLLRACIVKIEYILAFAKSSKEAPF